jgi:hypothetical protein
VTFVKDWLLGVVVAGLFLTSSVSSGPVFGIYKLGRALAELVGPSGMGDGSGTSVMDVVAVNSGLAMITVQTAADLGRATVAWASFVIGNPALTWLVALNTLASYGIKMVLQVGYVFLLVFYWIVGPLVAPLVVLPQTRPVFVGWLKSLIAVAMWPVFFASATEWGLPGEVPTDAVHARGPQLCLPLRLWRGADGRKSDRVRGCQPLQDRRGLMQRNQVALGGPRRFRGSPCARSQRPTNSGARTWVGLRAGRSRSGSASIAGSSVSTWLVSW